MSSTISPASTASKPSGLHYMTSDEAYKNSLLRISIGDIEFVRRILLWLAFAVLPRTLEELYKAIAVEQGMDEMDQDSFLNSPQAISSLCGSLVSLSQHDHVRMAHLLVKDYVLSSDVYLPDFIDAR